MADDLKNRGPADASKINVHESWEVEYWTHKFGVTREKLEEAVRAVGTSARAVEEHFKAK